LRGIQSLRVIRIRTGWGRIAIHWKGVSPHEALSVICLIVAIAIRVIECIG
jgi:hypothetical protein